VADPKEAMNMGSSRTANTIADLDRGIGGLAQKSSFLKQIWSDINSVMRSVSSNARGIFGDGGGGGAGGGGSPNQVAANPNFSSAPAIQSMGYQSQSVASGPSDTNVSGGFTPPRQATNLTSFVAQNPTSGTLYVPEVGAAAGGGSIIGGGGGGTGIPGASGVPGFNNSGGTPESSFFTRMIGNLGGAISRNPLAAALSGATLLSNMVPSTADVVEANLLTQRAAFFGGTSYGNIVSQNATLAGAATLSTEDPQLDVMRAMVAAQSYGIVSPNFQNVLTGAANLSNILPGVGMEGTIRATGAMQQARNVNLLRGIGIQLRDEQGNLKPPDAVIDDIWKKICRDYAQAYGQSAKVPSLREVQIGLQPGNSLDSMLNMYFGNDPILKQLVTNGLIYKATTAGTATAAQQAVTGGAAITQAGVAAAGGTTEAVLTFTQRNAAMATLLGGVAAEGVSGFELANRMLTGLISSIGTALAKAILPIKTFTDTILSAAGGAGGDILSTLASLAGARAEGGPVERNKTYVVGEKGPELFIPTAGGVIIPNDGMSSIGSSSSDTYNNTYNFTVNVPNANTPEVISALKKLISELETNKKVSES
jgi:hypothetical protein